MVGICICSLPASMQFFNIFFSKQPFFTFTRHRRCTRSDVGCIDSWKMSKHRDTDKSVSTLQCCWLTRSVDTRPMLSGRIIHWILFCTCFFLFRVAGKLVLISTSHCGRGGVNPRQAATPSQSHPETNKTNYDLHSNSHLGTILSYQLLVTLYNTHYLPLIIH